MRYSHLPLEDLIRFFLSKGKEGDFWDFKQEWHTSIEDLLKDIICFANTVHDENCFIVFGVSNDCHISGMSMIRRKQADIIDAISNLQFAGDVLPAVSVETVYFENVELDVLIIYNTNSTPIYLKRTYGKMKQGCIYARVGDRNTPDNGNAEIGTIEQLWRKRLGLIKPPLEYIFDSLTNKLEWIQSEYGYYHSFKPEYTIEFETEYDEDLSEVREEFYSYTQTNESTTYSMLSIRVMHSIVERFQTVSLDSGRLTIPIAEWGYICLDDYANKHMGYKYYIQNSHTELLLRFMYDPENPDQRFAFDKYCKVILQFTSEKEKGVFERYVVDHIDELKNRITNSHEYSYVKTGNQKKNEVYISQLRLGYNLREMLEEFRMIK